MREGNKEEGRMTEMMMRVETKRGEDDADGK